MEPPPGSVPHPIGQGLAVAFRVAPGRANLVLGAGILLAVVYVVAIAWMTWMALGFPLVTVLLVLFVGLGLLQLLLALGRAAVVRGPVLVVDDAGIRTRDLVGWVQVPWSTLHGVVLSAGGVLQLEAPGGVYLNDRPLRRRVHRFKAGVLQTDPQHLLTYLQHRRSLARQLVAR